MRSRLEYDIYDRDQRLADLRDYTAELKRELSDAQSALDRELVQPELDFDDVWDEAPADSGTGRAGPGHPGWDSAVRVDTAPRAPDGYGRQARAPGERRDLLVNRGRSNAYSPGMSRRRKLTMAAVAGAALIAILALALASGGPAWPASVATVQAEASRACQNPDVKSEPDQVNFACAKATTQILWVFALLTSHNNPDYGDAKSGRLGLEPITPQQGGDIAWSLNLHTPYDPSNPIDSLQVAARAINNIIGGATLTGANGQPEVLAGLESNPANCRRYTGSAALRSRPGYPSLCARAVTSAAGQAALVADVYRKWVVGAPPQAAHDAAVLFENADDPGAAQVQAILSHLPGAEPPTES